MASMSRPSAVCGLLGLGFSGLHTLAFALFPLKQVAAAGLFRVAEEVKVCALAGAVLLLSVIPWEGPPRAEGEEWGRLGSPAVGHVPGRARAF